MKPLKKTLFIGDYSEWSKRASEIVEAYSTDCEVIFWKPKEAKPKIVEEWEGNWIFSFKSDLILSEKVLSSCSDGKINFHPAPPQYRGIGGYTYAVLNGDKSYGITAHHMVRKIDYGPIIKVLRFPMLIEEDPKLLRERSGAYCLILFYEIICSLVNGMGLPESKEGWEKKLYTRNELKQIAEEVSTK